jgi:ABC-2 type transport system permease protein
MAALPGPRSRSFGRLFLREQGKWWRTRRWWVHAGGWSVLLGGATALLLGALHENADRALGLVFGFGLTLQALAVIVLASAQVLVERQSGLAAWLLSRPASRAAYVIAKAVSDGLALALTMVLAPFAVVLGVAVALTGRQDAWLPGFALALPVVLLGLVFWHSFALLLSAVAGSRLVAVAVPASLLLFGSAAFVLSGAAPRDPVRAGVVLLAPWSSQGDVLPLLQGGWRLSAATLVPLLAAAGWTLLDYGVAVVAMRRLDV